MIDPKGEVVLVKYAGEDVFSWLWEGLPHSLKTKSMSEPRWLRSARSKPLSKESGNAAHGMRDGPLAGECCVSLGRKGEEGGRSPSW